MKKAIQYSELANTLDDPSIHGVLMTTEASSSIWRYSLALARAYERVGIEVFLAVIGRRPTPRQREIATRISTVRLFEADMPLRPEPDPTEAIERIGEWLLRLERRVRPDLIHLNHELLGSLAWQSPVVAVAHDCEAARHEAVHGHGLPGSWEAYRGAVRSGLMCADAVVAPTEATLNSLKEHYGLMQGMVIPSACELATVPTSGKQRLILSVARRWDAARNLSPLCDVAPNLEWPVYAAGQMSDEDQQRCETAGVTALGRMPRRRTLEWMSNAPIFVVPALHEPFGIAAAEAACSGCALVLSDLPSLRETWKQAALYVDMRNPAALRETLHRLIAQPQLRSEYAKRARLQAQHYRPHLMAERFMRLYGELIRRHQLQLNEIEENELALGAATR